MTKKILTLSLLLLFCAETYAQENPLCPWLTAIIKIENEEDILDIVNNGDGTLSLIHPTISEITELFSAYEIFIFERTFPDTQSTELAKLYDIGVNSQQLFVDVDETFPDTQYDIFGDFGTDILINNDFIDLVDGKLFRLSGSIQTSDLSPCSTNCVPTPVEDDVLITISFSYNPSEDVLTMSTTEETSCGNSFSINLSGGVDNGFDSFDDLNLQTWSINSGEAGESSIDDNCYSVEQNLYGLLQINCLSSEGNVISEIVNPAGVFHFVRPNALGGEDRIEFRDVQLSIEENVLENIYVYQIKNNPFLQVHNPNEQQLSLEVFDILGRQIVKKTRSFKDIQLAQLDSKSLYLARISDTSNNSRVFKFIKR